MTYKIRAVNSIANQCLCLSLDVSSFLCAQTTVIIISVCVFVSDLIAHASSATSSKMFAVSYVEKCRAEKAHLGEQECILVRDLHPHKRLLIHFARKTCSRNVTEDAVLHFAKSRTQHPRFYEGQDAFKNA